MGVSTVQGRKSDWKHARSIMEHTANLSNQPNMLHSPVGQGSRPQTATTAATSSNNVHKEPPRAVRENHNQHDELRYQRFVLSDPVAFSYLEEDPSTSILQRNHVLQGYQSYIVEQWVVSRTHPTFMITAFTGDSNHKITVGVLSVPADEESWSPRLKVYFKSLAQYHAKRKETSVGILMLTNIAGFPSSLTLIAVPGGDVKKHREDFFVNENLKRFGCTGRSGISLGKPSGPTQAKFYQLFRTSDRIDFYTSVIDLVKLCQAALMMFDRLEPEYADGLLCDITERAFHEWWDEIGADMFNVEPKDGIVGPTTVAALLGSLIGARNRLHAYGAPVGKDVFEIEATKRAIHYFQKSQHMTKTRRLDRNTLRRLHKVTAKHASADGWVVPRAVKSTVAELSGKGGEMVMEMVGRDRASLADIETANIERFAQLVKGERAKWLWQGKARKRRTEDIFAGHPHELHTRARAQAGELLESGDELRSPVAPTNVATTAAVTSSEMDARKLAMWKRPARFARAAGKRGHNSQLSEDSVDNLNVLTNNGSIESVNSDVKAIREDKTENFFEENKSSHRRHLHRFGSRKDHPHLPHVPSAFQGTRFGNQSSTETPVEPSQDFNHFARFKKRDSREEIHALSIRPSQAVRNQLAAAESVLQETEFDVRRKLRYQPAEATGVLLRRTMSFSHYLTETRSSKNPETFPRNLSFSAAEDAIVRTEIAWQDVANLDGENDAVDDECAPDASPRESDTAQVLKRELILAAQARELRAQLAAVGTETGAWLVERLHVLTNLERIVATDSEQLASLYQPRREEHEALAEGSREIVSVEHGGIQDAIRDAETLGQRLEYEVESLRDKVEDVESAVAEFEKQVLFTEERVSELVRDGQDGTGRNIGGMWSWVESIFRSRSKEIERRQRSSQGVLARSLEKSGMEPTESDALSADEQQDMATTAKATFEWGSRGQEKEVDDDDDTPFTETKKHLQRMLLREKQTFQ